MIFSPQHLFLLPFIFSIGGLLVSVIVNKYDKIATRVLIGSSVLTALASLTSLSVLLKNLPTIITFFTKKGLGFELQIDSLSLILTAMISILCLTILVFSLNYLDGETRRIIFLRRVYATAISAMTLVCSGNLLLLGIAWVLTTVLLNRLLGYYSECPHAKIPARKKFILGRLSDGLLLISSWQLYQLMGTGNLIEIQKTLLLGKVAVSQLELIGIVLAIVALLKSAQFPFQGWLIEVVETPTPVSALLHAGILNSGPFFIMRFSGIFSVTHYGSLILLIIGGLTAVIGSLVLLSQPAVKTVLAYSSTAHMGFSIFLCGLGAYPAAFLHLVGHSFYKAYAFLNSGNAIRNAKEIGSIVPLRKTGSKLIALLSFALAITTYIVIAKGLGIPLINAHYSFVGLIIVLGLVVLYSAGLRGNYFFRRLILVLAMGSGVCFMFFMLEHLMRHLHKSVFLLSPNYTKITLILFGIIVATQAVIVFYQSSGFIIKRGTLFHRFYIHLRNGFYTNVVFDRCIGSAKILRKKS